MTCWEVIRLPQSETRQLWTALLVEMSGSRRAPQNLFPYNADFGEDDPPTAPLLAMDVATPCNCMSLFLSCAGQLHAYPRPLPL